MFFSWFCQVLLIYRLRIKLILIFVIVISSPPLPFYLFSAFNSIFFNIQKRSKCKFIFLPKNTITFIHTGQVSCLISTMIINSWDINKMKHIISFSESALSHERLLGHVILRTKKFYVWFLTCVNLHGF